MYLFAIHFHLTPTKSLNCVRPLLLKAVWLCYKACLPTLELVPAVTHDFCGPTIKGHSN